MLARESAVLCGAPWVEAAVRQLDAACAHHLACRGRRTLRARTRSCSSSQARPARLLTAERTALNFLQLLCARRHRDRGAMSTPCAARAARIVDTRKTLPGLRLAQKYAVRAGGGANHRIGLYDAILIKENHIAAAGGVGRGAARPRRARGAARRSSRSKSRRWRSCDEALAAGADHGPARQHGPADAARSGRASNAGRALLEVSGGVTLDGVRAIAETGVDRISIGALTKDVKATDFSMRFQEA